MHLLGVVPAASVSESLCVRKGRAALGKDQPWWRTLPNVPWWCWVLLGVALGLFGPVLLVNLIEGNSPFDLDLGEP